MSGKFRIVEHFMAPAATPKCKSDLYVSTSGCTPGAEGGNCAKKPTGTDNRIGGSGDNNCKCEDGHFPAVFKQGIAGFIVSCPESKPVPDCKAWSGDDKTKCCNANLKPNNIKAPGC